jgi:crossover junction endodeoxyribonuclease RuvC
MSVYVGIDAGVSGAVGVVDDEGNYVTVFDMPVKKIGAKNQVCAASLFHMLRSIDDANDILQITIEEVHAMPSQGVSSSFNFGMSFGVAKGIMAAMGVRNLFVTPTKWKRVFSLNNKAKDQSRTYAQMLWPACTELTRKKDCDRADALLIGLAGRKLWSEMS